MPVFLDTNVFIYAAGQEHPEKAPSVALLSRIAAGELEAVTSVEVVQELHRVYRRRGMLQAGLALGREVLRLFPDVLPIARPDLVRAAQLLERLPQLSPRDALHAATALNHGVGVIVSVDTDFDAVRELRRVRPVDLS